MPSCGSAWRITETASVAWRRWRRGRVDSGANWRFDPRLLSSLGRDVDVAPRLLAAAAAAGPAPSEQLRTRMRALRLDPIVVGEHLPGVYRDLQLGCSLCDSKQRCGRDLARDASDPAWQDYCPNAYTFEALQADNRQSP